MDYQPSGETGFIPPADQSLWWINPTQCLGTDICQICMNHSNQLFGPNGGTPPKAKFLRQPANATEEQWARAAEANCQVRVIHSPTISTES